MVGVAAIFAQVMENQGMIVQVRVACSTIGSGGFLPFDSGDIVEVIRDMHDKDVHSILARDVFNHGRQGWLRVSDVIPHHRQQRRWLRVKGFAEITRKLVPSDRVSSVKMLEIELRSFTSTQAGRAGYMRVAGLNPVGYRRTLWVSRGQTILLI